MLYVLIHVTLTQKPLHFVLVIQGLYLGEQRCAAGQRGPAEQQVEGLSAGERLRFEGEPLGLFVYTERRLLMLQHGAKSLQERAELSGLHSQPGRRRSDKFTFITFNKTFTANECVSGL